MIASPEWRERGREALRPELFEVAEYRELYNVLAAAPPAEVAIQLPGGLSHAAELAWSRLRESLEALAGADLDAIFTPNAEVLLSRPEWREIEAIVDPFERRARRTEWERRYPSAARARWVKASVRKPR